MSTAHHPEDKILVATDSMLPRDRISRVLFFFLAILLTFAIPGWIGSKIFSDFVGMPRFGLLIGLIVGASLLSFYFTKFIVRVNSVSAFVTTDQFASLFKMDKVYVEYGPGLHIAFPWERREAENNISLEEASESFELKVQGKTGVLNIRGSSRLRPDINALPVFLSGVGAVADDLIDIIKTKIVQRVAGMSIDEAMNNVKSLNDALYDEFVENKNGAVVDFERHFGIIVRDVTIAEMLPSEQVMKTRNAIDEAKIIAEGTAILLGYKTADEMTTAKAAGKLSDNQMNLARDRFMAASDNITMNLSSNEYSIRIDADPHVAEAIKAAGPALGPLLMQLNQSKKGK